MSTTDSKRNNWPFNHHCLIQEKESDPEVRAMIAGFLDALYTLDGRLDRDSFSRVERELNKLKESSKESRIQAWTVKSAECVSKAATRGRIFDISLRRDRMKPIYYHSSSKSYLEDNVPLEEAKRLLNLVKRRGEGPQDLEVVALGDALYQKFVEDHPKYKKEDKEEFCSWRSKSKHYNTPHLLRVYVKEKSNAEFSCLVEVAASAERVGGCDSLGVITAMSALAAVARDISPPPATDTRALSDRGDPCAEPEAAGQGLVVLCNDHELGDIFDGLCEPDTDTLCTGDESEPDPQEHQWIRAQVSDAPAAISEVHMDDVHHDSSGTKQTASSEVKQSASEEGLSTTLPPTSHEHACDVQVALLNPSLMDSSQAYSALAPGDNESDVLQNCSNMSTEEHNATQSNLGDVGRAIFGEANDSPSSLEQFPISDIVTVLNFNTSTFGGGDSNHRSVRKRKADKPRVMTVNDLTNDALESIPEITDLPVDVLDKFAKNLAAKAGPCKDKLSTSQLAGAGGGTGEGNACQDSWVI